MFIIFLIFFFVCRRFYLDAIPMVGTLASVKAMEKFISKNYVTGNDVELWLLSLSFIQRPSREMVATVIVSSMKFDLISLFNGISTFVVYVMRKPSS